MKERLLLTDVDGCLLNWNSVFEQYMNTKGFKKCDGTTYSLSTQYNIERAIMDGLVHDFNSSEFIRDLPAYKDSVEYVAKLKDLGFKFIAITSLGDEKLQYDYRVENLNKVFGEGTFSEVICLPCGENKYTTLTRWQNSGLFWIEDKFSNALAGVALGLKSILVSHLYNASHTQSRVLRTPIPKCPWDYIYTTICNDYRITVQ